MYTFESLGVVRYRCTDGTGIPRLAIEHIVLNPTECTDFSHLIGEDVEIDGRKYRVVGVDAHTIIKHPFGEKIGLLVEEIH